MIKETAVSICVLMLIACVGCQGTRAVAQESVTPKTPARPKPGDAMRVQFHKLAKAGSFDPSTVAVSCRKTRRGYEAAYIRFKAAGAEKVMLYSMPTGRVLEAPSTEGLDWQRVVPGSSPIAKGLPESCVSGARRRHFDRGFRPSQLNRGVVYAAQTKDKQVWIKVHSLSTKTPRSYGPVSTLDGLPMEKALALTTTRINDILLVGTVGGDLSIAWIEDVFIDELLGGRLARARRRHAKALQNSVKGKSYSITAWGAHLDRPFDSMAMMSDGKVYFGTMPHHPTKGAHIFRYDPATEKIENLGDIDVLSGEKEATDLPGMMHAPPVEAHGYVLFVGQDPFYGNGHKFPAVPSNAKYPGTHLLGYHMKTGKWKDFGVIKENASIFWAAAHPDSEWVYCREGYTRGPMHRVNVVTGKVETDLFHCPSKAMVVDGEGLVYYRSRNKNYRWNPTKRAVEECAALPEKVELPRTSDITYHIMNKARDQGTDRAMYVEMKDHKTGARRELGIAEDQDGRLCQISHASVTGPDGTLYLAGPFFPKAGDAYSRRLKMHFLNECRFMVIKKQAAAK